MTTFDSLIKFDSYLQKNVIVSPVHFSMLVVTVSISTSIFSYLTNDSRLFIYNMWSGLFLVLCDDIQILSFI